MKIINFHIMYDENIQRNKQTRYKQ